MCQTTILFFLGKYCDWPALFVVVPLVDIQSTAMKMRYKIIILVTTTNDPCLSINNSLIGTAIFSVDAPGREIFECC